MTDTLFTNPPADDKQFLDWLSPERLKGAKRLATLAMFEYFHAITKKGGTPGFKREELSDYAAAQPVYARYADGPIPRLEEAASLSDTAYSSQFLQS